MPLSSFLRPPPAPLPFSLEAYRFYHIVALVQLSYLLIYRTATISRYFVALPYYSHFSDNVTLQFIHSFIHPSIQTFLFSSPTFFFLSSSLTVEMRAGMFCLFSSIPPLFPFFLCRFFCCTWCVWDGCVNV
ncbi:hypothetical protein L873DRAFT_665453 [Choiromyces venosus 120613-1]|uniref:Uncharacterized protein n=1 Tax=Choiromyces venosus 120613-1 TaxID=1336337 RepID=A0A3N4IYE2_9PEZI|nr:hypothetical protein L873DRAFT_665453 [Choiromyces venosus 120613-1]